MTPIFSMTGFATGRIQHNSVEIACEIRSLNARYLEIFTRLPQVLRELEDPIKERVRRYVHRGKISVSMNLSSVTPVLQNLSVDPGTIQTYTHLLDQIRKIAGIQEPLRLEHLLFFKDVISFEEEAEVDEEFKQVIFRLVENLLEQLNGVRAKEGKNLHRDLEKRLEAMARLVGEIRRYARENPTIEFQRLYQRLLSLIEEQKVDRDRLEQEVAIISDRVDVTEELVRLDSHMKLFRQYLEKGSPIGKKLNFLLQEMHREANTIASKQTMIEISHRVVALKDEIERLREQVQNIE